MNRRIIVRTLSRAKGFALAAGVIVFSWVGWAAQQLPVPSHPSTAAKSALQRNLFNECELLADHSQRHLDELGRDVHRGHPQANEIHPRLTELRGSVMEMLEDHSRFLRTLTEQQWAISKDALTTLEMLRATLTADLEGMDMELKMPAPNAKILLRYIRKTDRALREWNKEHQSMGVAVGMTNRA